MTDGRKSYRRRLLRESGLTEPEFADAIAELEGVGTVVADGKWVVPTAIWMPRRSASFGVGPSDHEGAIVYSTKENACKDPRAFLAELPEFAQRYISHEANEREWSVLRHRFGLRGATRMTLEELGSAYGVTRERIRQVEAAGRGRLRRAIFGDEGPRLELECREVAQRIVSPILEFPLGAMRLDTLTTVLGLAEGSAQTDSLRFLLACYGLTETSSDRVPDEWIWGRDRAAAIRYQDIQEKVASHLAVNVRPLHIVEILSAINRRPHPSQKLSVSELAALLADHPGVELLAEGIVRPAFGSLEGRGNQVEYLLREFGVATHAKELVREINRRSRWRDGHVLNIRNLRNQLGNDSRFQLVGKSGFVALAEWSAQSAPQLELIERYLARKDRPASADEIYQHILSERPVEPGSIALYLASNPEKFRKYIDGRWGLIAWNHNRDRDGWTRADVTAFIEKWFRDRRVAEADLSLLRGDLMSATGVSSPVARGLLSTEPSIRTTVLPDRTRRAALVALGERPQKRITLRRTRTLRERVAERTQELMAGRPDGMGLNELITKLRGDTSAPEYTLRNYVAKLPFLVCEATGRGHAKHCRLTYPAGLEKYLLRIDAPAVAAEPSLPRFGETPHLL